MAPLSSETQSHTLRRAWYNHAPTQQHLTCPTSNVRLVIESSENQNQKEARGGGGGGDSGSDFSRVCNHFARPHSSISREQDFCASSVTQGCRRHSGPPAPRHSPRSRPSNGCPSKSCTYVVGRGGRGAGVERWRRVSREPRVLIFGHPRVHGEDWAHATHSWRFCR